MLVRAHLPLTGLLAGLFFFLPGMVRALFGPAPLAPPANVSAEQLNAMVMADLRQQFPWLLAVTMASTLGSLAILRLWLARSGTHVGEAMIFPLAVIPTRIAKCMLPSFLFGIAVQSGRAT